MKKRLYREKYYRNDQVEPEVKRDIEPIVEDEVKEEKPIKRIRKKKEEVNND